MALAACTCDACAAHGSRPCETRVDHDHVRNGICGACARAHRRAPAPPDVGDPPRERASDDEKAA